MNFTNQNIGNIENRYKRTSTYISKKLKTTIFRIFIILSIYLVVLLGALGLGTIKGIIDNAPNVDNINITPQAFLTTIYDSDNNEIQRLVQHGSNRIFVPFENIPKHVQDAFIAIEDKRFRQHHGIDPEGIARAFIKGLRRGSFNEGASTLTQQVIKNSVFNGGNEVSFLQKLRRKIQEQFLAIEVEKRLNKDQIIEGYLNTINLGYNSLGIQTASKRYFNKDVRDLTVSEATVLAAIPQNPTLLNPISGQERNKSRRETILKYMLDDGFIDKQQYEEALADDVYTRIVVENANADIYDFSYFTDALVGDLVNDMIQKLGYSRNEAYNKIFSGGLKIYSTQDTRIQKIADEEINSPSIPVDGYTITYRLTITNENGETVNLSDLNITRMLREETENPEYTILVKNEAEARALIDKYKATLGTYQEVAEKLILNPQPQLSFTVMDSHNGEVKAIVGGRGEKDGALTLNRATGLYRQPGSTIKPLLDYAPGIDLGYFNKSTTFIDEPYKYSNGVEVNTVWGRFFGEVDMTKALCYSLNVPAIKALKKVTPEVGLSYLRKMNFDHILYETNEQGLTDVHLASALGGFTYGVTNLQLTSAYSSFANNGLYTKPRLYTKVLDSNGDILLENRPESIQVYKKRVATDITDILSQLPKIYIKGVYGEQFDEDTTQVAAKTGTTNDFMDSWMAGYSAYYSASIWMGYDNFDKSVQDKYQFITWNKIMSRVHQGNKYKKIYGN